MHYEGSIRAVNLRIRDFNAQFNTEQLESRPANFAKAKLSGKFEEPKFDLSSSRRNAAWEKWIEFDQGLQTGDILGPHWAKARLIVRDILSDFRMGELTFTNGSSFEPLGVHTSIACKLSGNWTITADCFDLFAKYSYWHRGLRRAVKKRFKCYCKNKRLNESSCNRILWEHFKDHDEMPFHIFKFKLFCSVSFVMGNRWSTVPKNNLKDRSICLEPLCNMLVQRAVGLGIRKCLKDKLGIDLDTLADVHRYRIRDNSIATIDLSDCSDAISVKLIRYLLPSQVLRKVLASRSDMTLGPDDNFYIVNKVSSMGNGFTFDLMSLVLTALTRSFDPTSTVFGDDIICQNLFAYEVVSSLQIAGFVVNSEKTNINSDYRESCGAHYIDNLGYLTAFDLRWLKSPHDLIVALNKVAILSYVYGEPFETLRAEIWSCVPKTLLGATVSRLTVHTGRPPSYDLDSYVRYGPEFQQDPPKRMIRPLRKALSILHKVGNISVATSLQNGTLAAKSNLTSDDWDIFLQYIHNSRMSRKVPRLVQKSSLVARVDGEQIGPIRALLSVRS